MIAVALLTCGRLDYTATTLTSFARHNDLSRFVLLHGDDASAEPEVREMPRQFGFTTVVQSEARRGWRRMRRHLFAEAAKAAEWVLFLENDIEWARPFPWALFEFVAARPQFYCLRLQGAFKDRDARDPFMVHHKADRTTPVRWLRLKHAPESAQAGRIHWTAQPSVTRVPELMAHHLFGTESDLLTVRVKENVAFHIGYERTVPPMVVNATAEVAPC